MPREFHNGLILVPRLSAGAPTSGTWPKGALICDSAGAIFKCTAAGTPGTWVELAAGGASFDPDKIAVDIEDGSVVCDIDTGTVVVDGD